jgi:hypothetical protein
MSVKKIARCFSPGKTLGLDELHFMTYVPLVADVNFSMP